MFVLTGCPSATYNAASPGRARMLSGWPALLLGLDAQPVTGFTYPTCPQVLSRAGEPVVKPQGQILIANRSDARRMTLAALLTELGYVVD